MAAGERMRPRRSPHVVVVGDVVLDRDVTGSVQRVAPDAPVPVVDVTEVTEGPGGAGLTALLCATGARTTLVAPLADDAPGRLLRSRLQEAMAVCALPAAGATRCKVRLRSAGQTLLRMDDGGPGTPLRIPPEVAEVLARADVVVVSDYGTGLTAHRGLRRLLTAAARSRPVVWDPHPRGARPVAGVRLVTPNLREAHRLAGAAGLPPELLAERVCARCRAGAACVTLGGAGALLAVPGAEPVYLPTTPSDGEVTGAGDRFVATVAVQLASGALLSEAVTAAVEAGSRWVAGGGASAFRRGAPRPGAIEPIERLRARGRLVATGGCFDILHSGHVATLQAARRLGDALVVLVNSDASVRRLKGPGRPVVPLADRVRVLEALDCVDAVVVFDEDDPTAALAQLRPDIWAKGGDYGAAPLPEAAAVSEHGGRVVLLPYLGGHSTTSLIERAGAMASDR